MSVTPLSAGLKNWHWRQKQVDKWAYDWFKTNAPSVRGSDATAGIEVAITGVKSIEGDVTVGQRKSKVVTIYDLDMTLGWTATVAADETTLEGTVQIPEVSHEAIDGLSDYAYNFTSPSSGTPPYLATRKLLPTLLEPFFSSFRDALVDVHGKDMIAAPEPAAAAASASASGSSTPGAGVASASSTPATAANPTKDGSTASSSAAAKINTSTVLVRAELRISAADLWSLLTDEAKIPSWSRSAAQFSPTPGAPFALFGGSVKGRILSAQKPTTFSSTWALVGSSGASGWPAGHEGTLEVKLEQGQEATTASFTLEGVPRGREKEMESNLHAFYIRGFVAMGLGSDLNAAMNM